MATATSIGRSPQKRGPAGLILAIGMPKRPDTNEPDKPDVGQSAKPPDDPVDPATLGAKPSPDEHEQRITPEAAWFTGPDHVCAQCEHFSDANGVGECDEVEADYTQNDPMSSQCRLWEGKESPEMEKAEEEPTPA